MKESKRKQGSIESQKEKWGGKVSETASLEKRSI
jgi:hypothetical protein